MEATLILNTILKGEYEFYGLRALTIVDDADVDRAAPELGSVLAPSRVWDDNEMTDEVLPGTCAYLLPCDLDDVDDVERHIKHFEGEGYYGKHTVLVGGFHGQRGEDMGEIIIRDAKVLAVWSAE